MSTSAVLVIGLALLPAIAGGVAGYHVSGRHWWGAVLGAVAVPATLAALRG